MGAILPFIQDHGAFDPEATRAMSVAFEAACAALAIPHGQAREREVIAIRIIDLARTGVVDSSALSKRVLSEAQSSV